MRIDVHSHFLHQDHMNEEAARLNMAHGLSREKLLGWSKDVLLETMEKNNIDAAIGSMSTPGVWYGDVNASRRLARQWNDNSARLVQEAPGKFGMFAVIAPPDIDGALVEMDYALETLKADGIGMFTNYDSKYPGDPAFAPVYEELNRRKATLFFHPTVSISGRVLPGIMPQMIEFPFDTTRAIVSVIMNGAITRYPYITWIFSHAGGATPMLSARIDRMLNRREERNELYREGAREQMRKMYFDVAGASSQGVVSTLRELMPLDHILYGSDAPFVAPGDELEELDHASFTPADRKKIEHDNPLRLFPRFAQ
jgi:6-methylsalicylate decarboxylase